MHVRDSTSYRYAHIPPCLTDANSAFFKHIRGGHDGPFDSATLAQAMVSAMALYIGIELSATDITKFSCEQISVALVAPMANCRDGRI